MKLFVQDTNSKFVNNLRYLKYNGLSILDTQNMLYKIYYTHTFGAIMFSESNITREALQFISEFFQTVRCFIYHDRQPNQEIINEYGAVAKNIVNSGISIKNTIQLPTLVNETLINGLSIQNKNTDTVCFLENVDRIPIELETHLYPASMQKIKLFNNSSIRHYQNLGLLSEPDKINLLGVSKAFIPIEKSYLVEAVILDCDILDLSNNLSIMNIDKALIKSSYSSYSSFLEKLLYDK